MKLKIGFNVDENNESKINQEVMKVEKSAPKKSVVKVFFPHRNMTLSYFNDSFDLHEGDIVYVDGKLEGYRGRVVEVSYNFKIKISDYKKVIAVSDTDVKGQLFMAGSHFIAFDKNVLPFEKVLSWYKAPVNDEDEFVSGNDDTGFALNDMKSWNAPSQILDRGFDYYIENNVVYICVDGENGKAIVEGSKPYEVEFQYKNGEISNLVCDCFCSGVCKHQVAVMFQLKDLLKKITENYSDNYNQTNYFAAVYKGAFINFVLADKNTGSFIIE